MRHLPELYGDPDLKLEGLSLWALRRESPSSEDFWDGNWIIIYACVEAPGARVDVQGPLLRSDEVEEFLEELRVLDRDLKGIAELRCMEPMLHVIIECTSLGHTQIMIEITPDQMTQTHRFEFLSDQTYLASAIKGCRAILLKYPTRKVSKS